MAGPAKGVLGLEPNQMMGLFRRQTVAGLAFDATAEEPYPGIDGFSNLVARLALTRYHPDVNRMSTMLIKSRCVHGFFCRQLAFN